MADEQVVKLLEEIRDLHKAHLEDYRVAMIRQNDAINLQKSATRRSKVIQAIFAIFLLTCLALWLIPLLHR